jgi:hypothetical protein
VDFNVRPLEKLLEETMKLLAQASQLRKFRIVCVENTLLQHRPPPLDR